MKQHIPNAVTLLNLLFGCCAIVSVFNGQFINGFWFFFAAIFADYFDGTIARRLGVHSPLGKQLDSLADVISFGFLPGVILYVLLLIGWTGEATYPGLFQAGIPAFTVTLFSALRLAKFNIDSRQTDYFIGLPTPSACLFTVGLLLIYHFDSFGLAGWITHPVFLYGCAVFLSFILVAELPMFNLKIKSFQWTGNEIKFIFATTALLLLIFLREAALSLTIVLYILISLAQYLLGASEP